jgi:hypothetical protein
MAENNENFRDELTKLANVVEILENSFVGTDIVDIEIRITEDKLNYLNLNLNTPKNDKVIINIEKTNFIFSKK